MGNDLLVCHLSRVEYSEALALQLRLRERVQNGELPGVLLLLEHDPVYTRGRRTQPGELPMGDDWYRMQGIDVVDTPRGGKVTYHGPGQLVGYPIVHVDDVIVFLRTLEGAIIAALADCEVEAQMRDGLTGVWVGHRKIGSIGLHLSHGVTTHGFSVNVEGDLGPWSWIVPCGLDGVNMTSVAVETGHTGPRLAEFRHVMAAAYCTGFERTSRAVDRREIDAGAAMVKP